MQDVVESPGIVQEPVSVDLFLFLGPKGTRGGRSYRNLEGEGCLYK